MDLDKCDKSSDVQEELEREKLCHCFNLNQGDDGVMDNWYEVIFSESS